jgi:hypothetical protein
MCGGEAATHKFIPGFTNAALDAKDSLKIGISSNLQLFSNWSHNYEP